MAYTKTEDRFLEFILDKDLFEEWVGKKIHSQGKKYQAEGRVHELVRSANGAIIAWVDDTEPCATAVYLEKGIQSVCTCPLGSNCKHSVAIILEYLAKLKKKYPVPILPDDDPRKQLLANKARSIRGLKQSGILSDILQGTHPLPKEKPGKSKKKNVSFHDYVSKLPKEELITLLENLMDESPSDLIGLLEEKIGPDSEVWLIKKALLADLDIISAEEAISNFKREEYHVSDYSPVRDRIEILMDMGCYDTVLEIGSILIKKGSAQLEHSDDMEGETGEEIYMGMQLVFESLQNSTLSNTERIVYKILIDMDDVFGMCTDETADFLQQDYPASEWGLVADSLLPKLQEIVVDEDPYEFHLRYYRAKLGDWIITILDKAGREEEATDLCIAEVVLTYEYVRLVKRLINVGRPDEARAWITKGIEATRKFYPGITAELQKIEQELSGKKKK